jgi:hypothetical protein
METCHARVRLFDLQRYDSWIAGRFHISTRMAQLRIRGMDYNFRWLEQRLKLIGFRLVFVTRSPKSWRARRGSSHRRLDGGNRRVVDELKGKGI